jgi:hypothetical protein
VEPLYVHWARGTSVNRNYKAQLRLTGKRN